MTTTAQPVHINDNLFFDKKEKGKYAIIQPSLKLYGIIYMVKNIPSAEEWNDCHSKNWQQIASAVSYDIMSVTQCHLLSNALTRNNAVLS